MSDRPTIHEADEEEINLTPLLDVIFILLFFFLVATTLREEERRLEVTLPQASLDASPPREDSIQIVITAEGAVQIEDSEVTTDQIQERLGALVRENPERSIEILADAETQMQPFMDVATACQRLGVSFDLRATPAEGGQR